MGGTFDPIHFGHLVLAQSVQDTLGLQKILFIPTGDPPHKKHQSVTDAARRLEMVQLAIEDNPGFACSPMEVDRQGYSYTVDTLEQLKVQYGSMCALYFITGADAIVDILVWKDVARLAKLCQFVAATRPGTDKEKLSNFLEDLPGYLQKKVEIIQVPALEISSSDIRRRVAQGRPITYLLPKNVENYIWENKLYQQGVESNETND